MRYPWKCLDAHPGQNYNGGAVYLWDCNGTRQQQWTVTRAELGNVIRSMQDGRCLDANPPAQWVYGGPVYRWNCNGTYHQRWMLHANQGWHFAQVSSAHNGWCLNTPGNRGGNPTRVDLWGCNLDWQTQRWNFTPGARP